MTSDPQKFDDRSVRLITKSLPDSVDFAKLQLLPRVLNEWHNRYLREAVERPDPKLIGRQVRALAQIHRPLAGRK